MASITTFKGKRCTAVPKKFSINAIETPSPSSSTSTSSSSSSTSTSTSTSISTSSSSSTSTSTLSSSSTSTSSSSLSSSSTSSTLSSITSNPVDPQPTPVGNTATLDTAALPSTDSSSEITQSATSPTPGVTSSPLQIVAPATSQSSLNPSEIFSTSVDDGSISSVLVDTSATPSPTSPGDQTQNTDGTQSTDGQAESDLSVTTTNSDGSTVIIPTGVTQATGSELPGMQQQAVTGNALTTQQTLAIAGGVVGGVVVISLIAFAIWIWRQKKMQRRRSDLLTPLSPNATFRDGEKEPYLISRTSLGPTPLPEKLWAVIGAKVKRFRGKVGGIVTRSDSPSPSVNLNRGNSQYGPPGLAHSRSNSNSGGIIGEPSTGKGRFVDWWGRLAEDGNFNWRLRNESKADTIRNDSFAIPQSTREVTGPTIRSQPDFLTLSSIDDRQLEQGTARGRSGSQRRSVSMGSEQHFLGGLGLNFEMADPFSDVNAIGNNTAKATPTVVSASNNPFSNANAIAAPSTYIQDVRRTRGRSINGGISRQTSSATRMTSMYRESSASMDSTGTRRNKFRSDPFDLDRPDLLGTSADSGMSVFPGPARFSRSTRTPNEIPNTPQPAHVRTESFTSSKYSSGLTGVSLGDWSDPGPDVGPAAVRSTPDSGLGRKDSTTRRSGSSQGSVGKAL